AGGVEHPRPILVAPAAGADLYGTHDKPPTDLAAPPPACDGGWVRASHRRGTPMRFTIGMPGQLLRATYVLHRQHVEFSDGRPPLKVGLPGDALGALRRAFAGCWIMDQHGRSHPPLREAAPPRPGRGPA